MFLLNQHPDYRTPLDPADAETLGIAGADAVERFLAHRDNHVPTPLHALPRWPPNSASAPSTSRMKAFASGLGSFKALGGAYAVIRLVLEEAGAQLGRAVDIADLHGAEVRAVAPA